MRENIKGLLVLSVPFVGFTAIMTLCFIAGKLIQ